MKHSTKKGRRALSLLLCLVFAWTLAPVQAFAAGTYDPTDVDAVNKIIEENGLQAEKDAPESWGFAKWSNDTQKRLLELNLDSRSLTGTLDFGADGLEELTIFHANNNALSAVTGLENLPKLSVLTVENNQLTELDVTKNTELTELNVAANRLTGLDVSKNP